MCVMDIGYLNRWWFRLKVEGVGSINNLKYNLVMVIPT